MADSESTTATGHEPRHKPKTHFDQRATAAMDKHLPKTDWSIRSVRTRSGAIMSARSSSSQMPRCPTAAITEPQRISCSLPLIATGRRRPSSSGSPSRSSRT